LENLADVLFIAMRMGADAMATQGRRRAAAAKAAVDAEEADIPVIVTAEMGRQIETMLAEIDRNLAQAQSRLKGLVVE
jgi:hypothetical protein